MRLTRPSPRTRCCGWLADCWSAWGEIYQGARPSARPSVRACVRACVCCTDMGALQEGSLRRSDDAPRRPRVRPHPTDNRIRTHIAHTLHARTLAHTHALHPRTHTHTYTRTRTLHTHTARTHRHTCTHCTHTAPTAHAHTRARAQAHAHTHTQTLKRTHTHVMAPAPMRETTGNTHRATYGRRHNTQHVSDNRQRA